MQALRCHSCAPRGLHLAQSGNLEIQHTHTRTRTQQSKLPAGTANWTKTSLAVNSLYDSQG